jgi:hypothetical protein
VIIDPVRARRDTAPTRNLEKQVAIYEAASQSWTAVTVIVFYDAAQQTRIRGRPRDLTLERTESIVLIDSRSDNKPSASTA